MEKNFAVVTIFALLFTVSTARISLHSSPADFPVIQNCNDIKFQPESEQSEESNSNIVLPKSQSQPTDHNLKVDLTPRSDYARFHAINRHFFDESRTPLRSVHRRPFRHFQNPFMIPRSEISDDIHAFETKKLHRGTPIKRLKSRYDYTHRHHRHQHHRLHHHENNNNNNNEDVSNSKHKIEHEKVKNFVHQHNEKKREREGGNFVTSIRKFLKHSFE